MRKAPLVTVLSLLVLGTGCHSSPSAKQRYRETPGTYADLGARDAYINARTEEMTRKGMNRADAAAQASREWFARTPAAGETPTAAELARREAQADFEASLDQQRKQARRE
jgi:hypothetical protein